jgi:hypothetical protein
VVITICFWGPRPVKPWKRVGLLIASVVILAIALVSGWAILLRNSYVGAVLDLSLWAMGIFGIVIWRRGCDECVARCFGDA